MVKKERNERNERGKRELNSKKNQEDKVSDNHTPDRDYNRNHNKNKNPDQTQNQNSNEYGENDELNYDYKESVGFKKDSKKDVERVVSLEVSKRLAIVGSSHIAVESKERVINTFNTFKPDVVALELDRRRAYGLMSNEENKGVPFSAVFKIGLMGFLFSKIGGYLQRNLGQRIGTEPGIEMKTAMELAASHNVPVALIDQDLEVTMKKLSKEVGVGFIFRVLFDSFVDFFAALLHLKRKNSFDGSLANFDLNRIPDDDAVDKIIKVFKKKYPIGFWLVREMRLWQKGFQKSY
ncbi:MAG: hypothetical protein GWP09_00265 [Nitrospiraceae bacterium]|nr:hypothetical protein [Nitrospiraceae bacterium]